MAWGVGSWDHHHYYYQCRFGHLGLWSMCLIMLYLLVLLPVMVGDSRVVEGNEMMMMKMKMMMMMMMIMMMMMMT